jgi:hypothetical protein
MSAVSAEIISVLLGASEFPHLDPSLSREPFANSCNLFRSYLTSDDGLRLKGGDLLNLFNSPLSVFEQDGEITRFIREDKTKRTIILYYVGHGGFLENQDYFVTLHCTRPNKKHLTGYRMGDLATTLRDVARDRSVILILDCCFAGEAVKEFMPIGITDVIEKKTFGALPDISTALLVAASKDEPAISPEGKQYTMFTESFVDVLSTGLPVKESKLTLGRIAQETESLISKRYGQKGVRPQVHCPHQVNSDITSVPLFPNRFVGKSEPADRLPKKRSLAVRMRELAEGKQLKGP